MNEVRHVLGISGGKDSTALAIYLKQKYPELAIEYYFCDTGKELEETYGLIDNLEVFLGKKITRLNAAQGSPNDAFDHFLTLYGGFLPSSGARWCTKNLKLQPFEDFVGNDLVVSYVAIRGDENREAYISRKTNIQSIFPFRKNIWSQDVLLEVLSNPSIPTVEHLYMQSLDGKALDRKSLRQIVRREVTAAYSTERKLNDLLRVDVPAFNRVVFQFLKGTQYPLGKANHYPLVDNQDELSITDVFRLLKESGVGVPAYYEKLEFEVDGKKGYFSRSRSGCYFCFFQQKIEWVWLYERHPDLFAKAMEYEKEGYTWMQNERLEDLIKPERIKQIKEEMIKKSERGATNKSDYLLSIIQDADGEGCAACFI